MNDSQRGAAAAGLEAGLFRSHFEQLPDPAFIWQRSPSGIHLIALNRAAALRVGGDGEIVGRSLESFEGEYEGLGARLVDCFESGEPRTWEGPIHGLDGSRRWILAVFLPLDTDLVVAHTRDLTEIHERQAALRESEQRARALIGSNPEVLIRMSGDGRYIDCHAPKSTRHLLPLSPQQYIGRYVHELHDADFARQHEYYRRKAIREHKAQFWQYARFVGDELHHFEARFVRSGDDEVVVTVRDESENVVREREVLRSAERERRDIGRELHDGLAQSLTAAHFLLEAADDRLAVEAPEASRNVRQAAELVRQAIGETRDLVRGLGPVPVGPGAGFCDLLRMLAQQVESSSDLECSVNCPDGSPDVGDETAAHLYRILQEAAANAAKHAGATRLELSCAFFEGRFRASVQDDGCGFGIDDALSKREGMGLAMMRYRARAIGAELAIGPGKAGGTLVECMLAPRGRTF